MSTIKSQDEDLTLNAHGSGNDIKFQSNGVEKASISDGGVMTATSFAGSGANLTNLPAQTDSTKLPLAGGTMTGNLSFSNSDPQISNSSGNLKISAEDSLVIEMDNNSQNTGGEMIYFKTDPSTTAFTINESGRVDFGTQSTSGGSYGFQIQGSNQEYTLYQSQAGTGNFDFHRFYNGHGYIGRIRHSGGTLSFANLSDYRRKENVVPLANATTKLKQLNPIRYNLITDETNTPVDGFLAHEVSPVCPEAVGGEKDGVDSEGNPEYQFLDSTKLIPLLVKTIQELEARITVLES